MLKRFEVENYRGFDKRIVFDFSARDYSFNENLTYNGIVNKAIIYGKNGIGKSALGMALFDLVFHLTDNEVMKKPNYRNLNNLDSVVSFKYVFKFFNDEVIYEYTKLFENDLITEKLFFNGEKVIDYDYFGSEKYVSSELRGSLNINLNDNNLSVLKYIYRNTPTNSSVLLTKMMNFCENMLWYRSLSDGNSYMGYISGRYTLTDVIYKNNRLDEFCEFLRKNNLDYDLKFESENGEEVLYAYYNQRKNRAPFVTLASTGTQALLLFFVWKILAFEKASFLFIDEFDAFFHYESAELIVKMLNECTNLQSIITTHNTYLMQNKLTRPDCCFLMSKNKISNLYDSTDKEIREAHNLEKMYINGAFTE